MFESITFDTKEEFDSWWMINSADPNVNIKSVNDSEAKESYCTVQYFAN